MKRFATILLVAGAMVSVLVVVLAAIEGRTSSVWSFGLSALVSTALALWFRKR